MNTDLKKQWFLIYTRPGCEKKVAELLERKQVQVYCPLTKAQKRWSDRKKAALSPLFSSYVFVFSTTDEHARIRQTDGVINFIHWLDKPAVIRQEEIDTIRNFLKEYDFVRLEKTSINLNERVRIINGPLMMWEGTVVEIRTTTVKIILPSLGYALVAEISKENTESVMSIQELKMKAG
ncbi:MAG: UpxY family transcription antiterminator [Chitinophagaceae bacterium]